MASALVERFRAFRERLRTRFRRHGSALTGGAARRKRRRRIGWAIAIVCLLAAYPVLGSLALWTGLAERLIQSEDLKVEIENPSWTVLPGRVHVASARILVNGETQFELRAKNLLFDVEILPLIEKRLHVTRLKGDDVRYFMRVQVDDTRGIEERLAAYPKLPDLPGDATVAAKKGHRTEEREGDFTVDVEGIDVDVAELWFMEYHYVGDATLRGGFLIGPNRMRVATSVQELGPGQLRFGRDQVIAERFRGRVQAAIPEVNPKDHADASFLELVTASIELRGDVQTLKHVAAYLPGMEVTDGAGPFATRLLLEKGYLGDGSQMTFQTKKVVLKGDGFSVLTDWDLDLRVAEKFGEEAGKKTEKKAAADAPEPRIHSAKASASVEAKTNEMTKAAEAGDAEQVDRAARKPRAPGGDAGSGALPRLRSSAQATYVSFANEQNEIFTVQVLDHRQDVTLKSKQLGSMTDIQHAHVRFPEIVSGDMDDLSVLGSGSLESKSGTARASLFLDVDEKHVARGPFKARFDGLRLVVAGLDVSAHGDAGFRVSAELDRKAASFEDISLRLRDVDLRVGEEHVRNWWFEVSSQRLATWGVPPTRIEADFAARARNADPVLRTLAAKDELSDLIADLVALNDLRLRGKLRKRGETMDVVLDPFESNLVDVAGRFYSRGEQSWMAFVVGGKAVSLGFAKNRGGTTLMPFAREGWLNDRLREFPGEDERVAPSKP